MKTKIAIALISLGLSMLALAFILGLTAEQPPAPRSMTPTEVVMFCQQLAAETQNKGWSYGGCVEEIGKTLRGKVRVL